MTIGDILRGATVKHWAVVGLGVIIGLMVSYGRELNEDRAPDRRWWAARLLAVPFLAVMAEVGSEWLGFASNGLAALVALFVLLAYDLINIVTTKFLRRAADKVDELVRAGEAVVRLEADAPPAAPMHTTLTTVRVESPSEIKVGAIMRDVAKTDAATPPDMVERLKRLDDAG